MMLVGSWITFTQDGASLRTIPLILAKASTGRSNFFLIWFGNASRIPNLLSKNPACQDSPLQTLNTHIGSSTKHAKLNACCTPLECNPCDMKLGMSYYIMSKTLIWKNKVNRMMDHFCLWSPYHICLIPWSWPKSCQAGPIFFWSELEMHVGFQICPQNDLPGKTPCSIHLSILERSISGFRVAARHLKVVHVTWN